MKDPQMTRTQEPRKDHGDHAQELSWITEFPRRKLPRAVVIFMAMIFGAYAILGIASEINYRGWAFYAVALIFSLTIRVVWGRFGFGRRWILVVSIFLGVMALISFFACSLIFYWYIGAYSGNADQRGGLGDAYIRGNEAFQKDRARGEHLLQESCDGGDSLSCHILGMDYQYGLYVEKDHAKAEILFTKAYNGDGNYPKADTLMDYRSLAFDYLAGEDSAHAVSMFNKACDWGDSQSCAELGLLYENGTGVPQDPEKAKQFLSKSCSMVSV